MGTENIEDWFAANNVRRIHTLYLTWPLEWSQGVWHQLKKLIFWGVIYVDPVDRVYGGCEKSSIREEKKKNKKKKILYRDCYSATP